MPAECRDCPDATTTGTFPPLWFSFSLCYTVAYNPQTVDQPPCLRGATPSYTFSLLGKSMKPSAAYQAQRRVWALIWRSRRGVSGAEQEHSLSKARVKHDRAWSPNGGDDRYVLGFAPVLRLLPSQIMCTLQMSFTIAR